MDTRTPPKLTDFPSLAEGKQARALFFKNLPRRDRTPRVVEVVRTETVEVPVEVVRTETVEVEKIVYVDREVEVPVEVERVVYVDREVIRETQPEGQVLDFDPLSEFLARERREDETDEAALARLRDEIVDLLALQRDGGLAPAEEGRLRYLTGHIKLMGD